MAKKKKVVVLFPRVYNPANGVYAMEYDLTGCDAIGFFFVKEEWKFEDDNVIPVELKKLKA